MLLFVLLWMNVTYNFRGAFQDANLDFSSTPYRTSRCLNWGGTVGKWGQESGAEQVATRSPVSSLTVPVLLQTQPTPVCFTGHIFCQILTNFWRLAGKGIEHRLGQYCDCGRDSSIPVQRRWRQQGSSAGFPPSPVSPAHPACSSFSLSVVGCSSEADSSTSLTYTLNCSGNSGVGTGM